MKILIKYSHFANLFLFDFAAELQKYISINSYSINLVDNKQLLYILIYNLKMVELEILKTYIKTNLVNKFI